MFASSRAHTIDPYSQLHYALYGRASFKTIEKIVSDDPRSVREADPAGLFPLHIACSRNAPFEVIKLLYSQYRWALETASLERCQLPLHMAVEANASLSTVQFLADAYPAAMERGDVEGHLPLHLAVQHQQSSAQEDLVRLLIERYPKALQESDCYSCLPLHLAVMESASLAVIRLLVEANPRTLNKQDKSRRLPLHMALHYGLPPPVIEFLLQEDPRGLEVESQDGGLPIHIAARACHVGFVQQMLSFGSPLMNVDHHGRLPLHCALEGVARSSSSVGDALNLVTLLSTPEILSRPWGKQRSLPLHAAIQLQVPFPVIQFLVLAYPGALHQGDKDGQLPLHCAVRSNSSRECLQLLVEEAPKTFLAKNNFGQLPKQLAGGDSLLHEVLVGLDSNKLQADTDSSRPPCEVPE